MYILSRINLYQCFFCLFLYLYPSSVSLFSLHLFLFSLLTETSFLTPSTFRYIFFCRCMSFPRINLYFWFFYLSLSLPPSSISPFISFVYLLTLHYSLYFLLTFSFIHVYLSLEKNLHPFLHIFFLCTFLLSPPSISPFISLVYLLPPPLPPSLLLYTSSPTCENWIRVSIFATNP